MLSTSQRQATQKKVNRKKKKEKDKRFLKTGDKANNDKL